MIMYAINDDDDDDDDAITSGFMRQCKSSACDSSCKKTTGVSFFSTFMRNIRLLHVIGELKIQLAYIHDVSLVLTAHLRHHFYSCTATCELALYKYL